MQQENSIIPLSQYYLLLKWNGSNPAQIDMMQSDQVLICLPPNTNSL